MKVILEISSCITFTIWSEHGENQSFKEAPSWLFKVTLGTFEKINFWLLSFLYVLNSAGKRNQRRIHGILLSLFVRARTENFFCNQSYQSRYRLDRWKGKQLLNYQTGEGRNKLQDETLATLNFTTFLS